MARSVSALIWEWLLFIKGNTQGNTKKKKGPTTNLESDSWACRENHGNYQKGWQGLTKAWDSGSGVNHCDTAFQSEDREHELIPDFERTHFSSGISNAKIYIGFGQPKSEGKPIYFRNG